MLTTNIFETKLSRQLGNIVAETKYVFPDAGMFPNEFRMRM
jgi:hypothetical protein